MPEVLLACLSLMGAAIVPWALPSCHRASFLLSRDLWTATMQGSLGSAPVRILNVHFLADDYTLQGGMQIQSSTRIEPEVITGYVKSSHLRVGRPLRLVGNHDAMEAPG